MVLLQFKHGDPLKLHRHLFEKTPRLAAVLVDAKDDRPDFFGLTSITTKMAFRRISRSAGYVLIQYLYTSEYHTLKWISPENA